MKRLTIGKMAELNGISRQTLRLYDQLGILTPSMKDERTGYRYYSTSQCARLDMIQHMKSLGMELRTIKDQLSKKDISLLQQILEQKKDGIDRQIRELKHQKRAVERMVSNYELYTNSPPDGTVVLEYIGKRLMYIIDSGINFYDYDIDVYEEILRKFKENLLANRLPHIYFNHAGTILRKKHLVKREFKATEFFVFVDKEYVTADLTDTLPAGMYLCIYCNRFEKEQEYSERLLDVVEEQNYIITGDCVCEVIVDSPVFEDSRKGMFFRIQIPIKFG